MMRAFGFLGTVITLAIGMYIYSLQTKALGPGVGSSDPAEIALLTGVKNDLIVIANAERGYLTQTGKYGTLDELTSGNYITIKSERPPYVYDIETPGGTFRVTATRTTKGTPAQLWITEDMQVQSSN